jgi:hypothetical protein
LHRFEGRIAPAVFTVANTADAGPGSLRQAVLSANAAVGADTIDFDPAVFASPQTITLTTGQLRITDTVAVTGPGAGLLTVDAGKAGFRVLEVNTAGSVAVAGMTITGGRVAGRGGGILVSRSGPGGLALTDVTLTGNETLGSAYDGGAIDMQQYPSSISELLLERCTLANNIAAGDGGAVCFSTSYDTGIDKLTIRDSAIYGNVAANTGGAVWFLGGNSPSSAVIVENSTISGNVSGASTIKSAVYLGGINAAATVLFRHATVTANRASYGTGNSFGILSTPYPTAGGVVRLEGSIVSDNIGTDIWTPLLTSHNSLVGSVVGTAVTDLGGTQYGPADLLPLADYGGPTRTHALRPLSRAINGGGTPLGLSTDQRGQTRVVGPAADVGAFEAQTPLVQRVAVNSGAAQRSRVTSMTVTFSQPVTLPSDPAAAFQLTRQGDNAPVNLTATVADNAVTLHFIGGAAEFGSLADGRYTLAVLASQVNGGAFDGNGDGVPGDNFVLVGDPVSAPKLFRLFGDHDGDGDVDAADFGAFRQSFGGVAILAFDSDGDGDVDAADFSAFRLRFGAGI